MRDVLAVDLGKTGCRAVLWRPDGQRTEANGPGAPGLAFAGGVEAAEAAILHSLASLAAGPGCHACVGAAGALAASPCAGLDLARRLRAATGADCVAVTGDAVTAHAGALAGGAGIVLAVGTGTVAVAAGPGSTFVRVDGCGPWLGDEGSGAAIGLAGLRAVLRAADGRGPPTTLTQAVVGCYGVAVSGLPARIGNTPDSAREAARFAASVVGAAEGDAVALAIVEDATDRLAATVRAAAARSGLPAPVPLVLAGGVMNTGPVFTGRLLAALATVPVRIVPARGTALDGARLLATVRTTLHEPLVVRHPA